MLSYGTKRSVRCRVNEYCVRTSKGYQCLSRDGNNNLSSLPPSSSSSVIMTTAVENFAFDHNVREQKMASEMKACPGGWQLSPSGECIGEINCMCYSFCSVLISF